LPESHCSTPEGRVASALFAALEGSSVTVCPTALVLRQVTVVPFGTVSVLGSNLSELVMLIVKAAALATPEVAPVVRVAAGWDVRVPDGLAGAQATLIVVNTNRKPRGRTSVGIRGRFSR
jgi:hypothetical protein